MNNYPNVKKIDLINEIKQLKKEIEKLQKKLIEKNKITITDNQKILIKIGNRKIKYKDKTTKKINEMLRKTELCIYKEKNEIIVTCDTAISIKPVANNCIKILVEDLLEN